MRMIALKDFYDHYAGHQLKQGDIFSVIDSRADEMLSTIIDGSPICEEYVEPKEEAKHKFKLTANKVYNMLIVLILFVFVIMAYISKLSLALTYILSALFVLVMKIMINTRRSADALKAIYKNIQNK